MDLTGLFSENKPVNPFWSSSSPACFRGCASASHAHATATTRPPRLLDARDLFTSPPSSSPEPPSPCNQLKSSVLSGHVAPSILAKTTGVAMSSSEQQAATSVDGGDKAAVLVGEKGKRSEGSRTNRMIPLQRLGPGCLEVARVA